MEKNMYKSMKTAILLVGLIAVIVAFSGCNQPVSCTAEAKVCPDGSTVGRNAALNCEFDPCPAQPSCTAEAKVCPDGSTVGRNSALNCQFDPCPIAACKGEGETVPVIAEPPSCCAGLNLIPPKQKDILGSSGICTAKCGNGSCDNITETAYNCPQDCNAERCDKNWSEWESIKTKEECESCGGRWSKGLTFLVSYERCDMPYPDAEKACNDSSDCESKLCLYTGSNPVVDTVASGQCASWISTSCVNHHYFIENGKIVERMCVE